MNIITLQYEVKMEGCETEQECRERIERRTFNIQFDMEKSKGRYPILDLLNVIFGIDLRSR